VENDLHKDELEAKKRSWKSEKALIAVGIERQRDEKEMSDDQNRFIFCMSSTYQQ
jgi:hypothetical protein